MLDHVHGEQVVIGQVVERRDERDDQPEQRQHKIDDLRTRRRWFAGTTAAQGARRVQDGQESNAEHDTRLKVPVHLEWSGA